MGSKNSYVLGLDLGSASLGWVAVEYADGGPCGLLAAGVRIFDPGVDLNKFERGQEGSSNNSDRRMARLQRRQMRRRAARRRELYDKLASAGLLPKVNEEDGEERRRKRLEKLSAARQAAITRLDHELWLKWRERLLKDRSIPAGEHVLPYFLRKVALTEKLEPKEFGRALYHLGQRRGFKSNRKSAPKKDEDAGKVKSGIGELTREIEAANAPTLGAYFASLDPNVHKIRRRWTERSMFHAEFEKLWEAQKRWHSELLDGGLKADIHHLLFHQRPLMSTDHLVGFCELEKKERRAPWGTLEAQRFRMLQRVNDMELEEASGVVRRLTEEERENILGALEREGDQTFAGLRKLIGVKGKEARFNFERGGEKNCRGNRTAAKMRAVFGERWEQMSGEEQASAVKEWIDTESPEALAESGERGWGLSPEAAKLWAESSPEPEYCGFSLVALRKLLPHLEEGTRLATAIKLEYPEKDAAIYDLLPPLKTVVSEVRNPAIQRAMSELRKVVNALIREYGKPEAVRIELARDLKNTAKQREKIWKDNREREKDRKKAAAEVLKEVGGENASGEDIEKYRLAEECGWECPYSGKKIGMTTLFTSPEFQVEHILPLSRYPDNSFQNKTLCHVSMNTAKGNRTPHEAFHQDDERWAQILERVKKFGNGAKLKRFQMRPEETEAAKLLGEFTNRQLQDTRYSSKLAARYLSSLYGGRDEDGKRKVFASSGQVTATLRAVWQLNRILGADGKKNRDDHRHHAVDALVIGLTEERVIKRMSETSSRNLSVDPGKLFRPFKGMEQPWPGFVDSVRPHFEQMNISHRPSHKLGGALHEETLYSRARMVNGKSYVHVRKPITALSAGKMVNIVDPAVKKAVEAKLAELGGDVKKLGAIALDDVTALPYLKSKDGRHIPIKSVRVRKAMSPTKIGHGARERFVQPANNHHVEIFAKVDGRGKEVRWEGMPVSLLEAKERNRRKMPVIQKKLDGQDDHVFKFSLMGGDIIELSGKEGEVDRTGLWRVRTISSNEQIAVVKVGDARIIKEMRPTLDFWRPMPNALRKLNCRKVTVDLLGRVHAASD